MANTYSPIEQGIEQGIEQEIQDILYIANQAFLYGLPLVLVDITKLQSCQDKNNGSKPSKINKFTNNSTFMASDETVVVRPNFDTYYSSAFFDLSDGPKLLDIPITDAQYYMMPLLDAFTNVIPGSPGTRTKETQGGQYLLCGPWDNDIPTDSNYIPIKCPTNMVWAIGRFQVNNATQTKDENGNLVNASYAAYGGAQVSTLQSKLKITNINNHEVSYTPIDLWPDPDSTPNQVVESMDITDFFGHLNTLLVTNPPTSADTSAMLLFARIGVGPKAKLTFTEMFGSDTDLLNQMNESKNKAMNTMTEGGTPKLTIWNVNLDPEMADFGTDYSTRAGVAVAGLGANLIDDAVYFSAYGDSDGNTLNSSNNYTITFDKEPPQQAFWSLTMYNPSGFPVNGASRCALGHDSVNPLVKENDNSIVIYIQPDPVDPNDLTNPVNNNWLPSPPNPGDFNVMLRVYWPDKNVLNGDWNPPLIQKVASAS